MRRLVESARKLYHAPGSRFHKVWPLFDAMETFLFSPSTTAPKQGPHVRDYLDLKRTMWTVIVALVPCLLWAIWNTGHQHFLAMAGHAGDGSGAYAVGWLQGLLFGGHYAPAVAAAGFMDKVVFGLQQMGPIIFVSYFVGLNIEAVFSVIRKEEVSEGYLVSGMLIALIVPASIPLWQLAVAVAFAVVLAKEVFGGTGMNVFNVALMARAFMFFAYPAQISGDQVWVAGMAKGSLPYDGFARPTPLLAASAADVHGGAVHHAGEAVAAAGYAPMDMFLGLIPGSAGEVSKLAILIGAAILLLTRIASWRTMLGGVIGLLGTALLFNLTIADLNGMPSLPFWEHLLMGGFLFGIVFMATDPVTAPETDRGKWIYGIAIGAITVLVRAINPAYPEGTMLAILLLNAFAPTIDYFVVAANVKRRRARLG